MGEEQGLTEDFGRNRAGRVSRAPDSGREGPPIVHVVRLARVDSTNREAERIIAAESPRGPVMVVAGEQTAGEGRRGAAWSSLRGGLWATVAWPFDAPPESVLDGLGLRLGLAALRTVRTLAPHARLKWPNDVLLDARKVCGCMGRLLPARPSGPHWLLAAAGINANNPIDPDLAGRAASLREISGRDVDLQRLEHHLLDEFRWALTSPGLTPDLIDEANRALAGVGRPIRLRDAGESIEGTLVDLGPRGTPRIRTTGGRIVQVGPAAETVHDE